MMGANDKVAATFHPSTHWASVDGVGVPGTEVSPSEPVQIDEVSLADLLCDQLQLFMEEGGNDLQGEYVDDVTLGGRVVTVEWSNGQKFRIEVSEVLPYNYKEH